MRSTADVVHTLVETHKLVGHYRAHWDGTDQSGKPMRSSVW